MAWVIRAALILGTAVAGAMAGGFAVAGLWDATHPNDPPQLPGAQGALFGYVFGAPLGGLVGLVVGMVVAFRWTGKTRLF
jgi:hypothetical protein